jgi:hypothetical protein
MNNKVIRLTESDLVRIVKKVISEQPKPRPTSTPKTTGTTPKPKTTGTTPKPVSVAPVNLVGKEIVLYKDANMQNVVIKVTVKSVRKQSDGRVVLDLTSSGESLTFDCTQNGYVLHTIRYSDGNSIYTKMYNKPVLTQLTKDYCMVGSGGRMVPKADYADNSSNTGSDFA